MRNVGTSKKRKEQWYVCKNGLSPAKTLGLTQDQRRCSATFCSSLRLLRKLNGACSGCCKCQLPEFYRLAKEHQSEAWVDLSADVQGKLIDLYFSPDFPPLPGFSNFPEDPSRQEKASIEPLEIPNPSDLQACSRLCELLEKRARNGWLPYTINRSLARATPAAMRALCHEPLASKDADFEVDRQMEEAKAEARKKGSATITVKLAECKRLNFDAWARDIQEYDRTGREFPLLAAIRRVLLQYPCLRSVLSAAALALGVD